MKRPISITIIGWIFIVVGVGGLISHLLAAFSVSTNGNDARYVTVHLSELAPIVAIQLLGLCGGVFFLLGKNWARWLLVVWMGAHVIISMRHSASEVMVHGIFLVVLVFFLFRPKASAWFRKAPPEVPPAN